MQRKSKMSLISQNKFALPLLLAYFACGYCHSGAVPQVSSRIELHSMCDLVALGRDSDIRDVRISATYVSDPMHGAKLVDATCNSVILSPIIAPRSAEGRASWDRFNRAVVANSANHSLRVFDINVSGIFIRRVTTRDSGVLVIDRIWSFKKHDEHL